MAKFKIILDVPEVEGLEPWLKDAIEMFGKTLGEGSKADSIESILPVATPIIRRRCYYMGTCDLQGSLRDCTSRESCDFLFPEPRKGKLVKGKIIEKGD